MQDGGEPMALRWGRPFVQAIKGALHFTARHSGWCGVPGCHCADGHAQALRELFIRGSHRFL
jgi:hypothetical protein